MTSHPNFDRAQAILDATNRGDYAPAFDNFTDDIVMENGPGAGPWHRARGKDDLALLLLELAGSFGETLRPDGTTERLWTVDLDAEHCEAFWEKNRATPSKDFS
jgi:ketosteroid isomerase-like protein